MHYIRLALQAASPEAFVVNDVDLLANNFWSLFLRTLALVYADCSLYFSVIGNVFKGIFYSGGCIASRCKSQMSRNRCWHSLIPFVYQSPEFQPA